MCIVYNRLQDDEDVTETQAKKSRACGVPDKCSLLIGRGWVRVPLQTQCTTTSAAEGRQGKEVREKLEDKESGEIAEVISQTALSIGSH